MCFCFNLGKLIAKSNLIGQRQVLKGSWRCHKATFCQCTTKSRFNKELREQCKFFYTLLISYRFETMHFQTLLGELDASKVAVWLSTSDNLSAQVTFWRLLFCFTKVEKTLFSKITSLLLYSSFHSQIFYLLII